MLIKKCDRLVRVKEIESGCLRRPAACARTREAKSTLHVTVLSDLQQRRDTVCTARGAALLDSACRMWVWTRRFRNVRYYLYRRFNTNTS